MRIRGITLAALLAGVLSVATLTAAAAPPTTKQRLQAKRAQAQSVLAQVGGLDRRFEASVEAWHGAQYALASTHKELLHDRVALRAAERQRRKAIARVEARLVALYEDGDAPTTIGVLFGSSNVSDLIDRIQTAKQVAAADHQLAVETTRARDRYASIAKKTAALERQRAADVRQLGEQRAKIGDLLGERKRMLASVQSEVTALRAQEAHEQAVLAARAKARLAAEQAELRREAETRARARADQKAAAAKAAPAQPSVTTTTATPTTTAAAPPPPAAPTTTTTTAAPAPTTTAPAAPPPPPAAPTAAGHPAAASIALRYLGIKYTWGGASPATGFDCSGLVMYVYAQLGISLPHFAAAQFGMGVPVARDQLQPGDLVFFDGLNHVGIYIGGGQMVHAPETGDVVKITPLSQFGAGYVGARRI